jgi:hypothetical protein
VSPSSVIGSSWISNSPPASPAALSSSTSTSSYAAARSTTQPYLSSASNSATSFSIPTSTTNGAASTASGQSSTSATAIVVEIDTPAGTYIEQGCYVDLTGSGFPLISPIASSVSTILECVDACSSGFDSVSFQYAGIEGTSCYCSEFLDSDAVTDPAACTQACQGDPSQICGGGGSGIRRRTGGGIVVYEVQAFISCLTQTHAD